MAAINYGDYEVNEFFKSHSVTVENGRYFISSLHPWRERVYEADAETLNVDTIRERTSYGGIGKDGKPFHGWSNWHNPWDPSFAPETCIGDECELAAWRTGENRVKNRVSAYLRRWAACNKED